MAGDLLRVSGVAVAPARELTDSWRIPSAGEPQGGKSFGQFLTDAIGDVNALQHKAGDTVQRFATGERMDVHQVMIALEQASTSLALTMQVRNKLVEAYQDISKTQV